MALWLEPPPQLQAMELLDQVMSNNLVMARINCRSSMMTLTQVVLLEQLMVLPPTWPTLILALLHLPHRYCRTIFKMID